MVCALIHSLPQGSQGATRDVAEAFRTIPLHPSLVVQVTNKPALFAVDTSLCFGYGPSAGTYGMVWNAGLDIFRAAGIGSVIAWVDDHLFFRLPRDTIADYNKTCKTKARVIAEQGGRLKEMVVGGSKESHWLMVPTKSLQKTAHMQSKI